MDQLGCRTAGVNLRVQAGRKAGHGFGASRARRLYREFPDSVCHARGRTKREAIPRGLDPVFQGAAFPARGPRVFGEGISRVEGLSGRKSDDTHRTADAEGILVLQYDRADIRRGSPALAQQCWALQHIRALRRSPICQPLRECCPCGSNPSRGQRKRGELHAAGRLGRFSLWIWGSGSGQSRASRRIGKAAGRVAGHGRHGSPPQGSAPFSSGRGPGAVSPRSRKILLFLRRKDGC